MPNTMPNEELALNSKSLSGPHGRGGRRRRARFLVGSAVRLLLALLMFFPIYYLLITTFKTPAAAASHPLTFRLVDLTFDNYRKAWAAMDYFRALKNNLIIVAFSVALLVILASMAAYVVTRNQRTVFKAMFSIFMAGLIIPFQIAIVPLYKVMQTLHLMNQLYGAICINVFCINLPFSIFLFRGFISTVPIEIEEAARIDGAGTLRTFWTIVFPLLKPIVSTVAILDTLAVWNDFMTPLLFLQDPRKGVLLQEVYKNVGPFATDWTSFFPMLVLATLPLVVFYFVMQKNIVAGVAAGAVKG